MLNVRKSFFGLALSLGLLAGMPAAAPAQTANSAVAEANKRVIEAQQIVNDLKNEQKRIKDRLINDFGEKEEWRNTVPDLAKAKKAFEAAKRQAELKLKNSPEYKKTLKEREATQLKMDELGRARNPDPKMIAKTGTLLAQQGTELKKMEASAIEQDGKAMDAKDALDKAEKKMKELEAEVDAALLSDPEHAQLEQQVLQAEQQLQAAKDARDQARKSARPVRTAPPRGARPARGLEGE